MEDQTRTQLLAEHQHLRQEMRDNGTFIFQTLTAILAITGGLTAFAVAQGLDMRLRALVFYLIMLIAYTGLVQNHRRTLSTRIIASYIRVYIEKQLTGIEWESNLNIFRKHEKMKNLKIGLMGPNNFIYGVIISGSFILGSYHLYQSMKDLWAGATIVAIIGVVLIVIGGAIFWEFGRYAHVQNVKSGGFDRIWEDIIASNTATTPASSITSGHA